MKCKGIYYWHITKWNLYIGAPPKCGSTSIWRTLMANGMEFHSVRAAHIPNGAKVVFIVRHPLDRFRSLWRFRCVEGGDKEHGTGRGLHGATPAELWAYMRRTPDKHWALQVDLLEELQVRCDVTCVRLDELTRWWNTKAKAKHAMKVCNQTFGYVPTTYALEQRLRKHYAADMQLYEEARL